jgi:Domain of unknown function DUF29
MRCPGTWQFQPSQRSNSWRARVVDARDRIAKLVKDSPTTQDYPAAVLTKPTRRRGAGPRLRPVLPGCRTSAPGRSPRCTSFGRATTTPTDQACEVLRYLRSNGSPDLRPLDSRRTSLLFRLHHLGWVLQRPIAPESRQAFRRFQRICRPSCSAPSRPYFRPPRRNHDLPLQATRCRRAGDLGQLPPLPLRDRGRRPRSRGRTCERAGGAWRVSWRREGATELGRLAVAG